MTLQFMDGFDHESTTDLALKWDTVTGMTISSTQTRGVGGGGAIVSTSDTNLVRKMGLGAHSTYVIGAAFYITQFPLDWQIASFWETATQAQILVRLGASGTLTIYRGNEAASLGTATAAMPSLNRWYVMECKVVVSATVGSVRILVNRSQVFNLTGTNTQGGATTNINGVGVGSQFPGAGTFTALYVDDFYALNGAGTINNDFVGMMRVATLFPNGAGNYSQFTPNGATPNYACVDEATQDGDTTYVSGTPTQIDSYTVTPVTVGVLGVTGVQVNQTARIDDTTTVALATLQRSGGVDGVVTTPSNPLSTYGNVRSIFDRSLVTGLPWTVGEVNASEFGVEIATFGANLVASTGSSGRVFQTSMTASARLTAFAFTSTMTATAAMVVTATTG